MTNAPAPTVTIGIPVYKRFRFLPAALRSVAEQDYPEIDLLVSDNGENGPEVEELVASHYPRPFRVRQNAVTEPVMSRHFNQMVEAAEGKYFVLLCDDDELGPRFVSSLVQILEREPEVGVGIPRVEVMDETGNLQPREHRFPPDEVFSGLDFVRMWVRKRVRFWTFVTTLARTQEILDVGGYPPIPEADDDTIVVKLSLGRKAAFSREAEFRNRWYETSAGLSLPPEELADDMRRWIEVLDTDPLFRDFARRRPAEWKEIHALLVEQAWRNFRHRWVTMYRERMAPMAWLKSGFSMPFIPAYYRWLFAYLFRTGLRAAGRRLVGSGG
jgi:glycosyltransferase involved in cell wall biosynthesis